MKHSCTTILVALLMLSPAFAENHKTVHETVAILSGIAEVKDGDGIMFGSVEVRLQGIAAPEFRRNQKDPMGAESRQNLIELISGKYVVCHLDGTTASSNRPVGICYINDQDLGRLQVLAGLARDCPAFSKGRYFEDEVTARIRGNNLSTLYGLPPYC